jgi:hypothetical protein
MNSKRFLLSLLVTLLPTALISKSAVAFNLTFSGSSSAFTRYSLYQTSVGNSAYVQAKGPRKLQSPGLNSQFWIVLTRSFNISNGWRFQRARVPLYGTFNVTSYHVCSPTAFCDVSYWSSIVGTQFYLDYIPNLQLNDPDPMTGRVRWIQWVRSNHSLNPDIHGLQESVVDIDYSRPTPRTPYYYSGSNSGNAKSPYYFDDIPARNDIGWNHDWKAQLYLVFEELPIPGDILRTVTIYGGLEWMWLNRVDRRKKEPAPNSCSSNSSTGNGCQPYPAPPANPNAVCPPDMPPGSCEAFGYYAANALVTSSVVGFDEPSNQTSSSSNSQPNIASSATVPEPSSVLGLLAVGTWAGTSWRKRKNQQSGNESALESRS